MRLVFHSELDLLYIDRGILGKGTPTHLHTSSSPKMGPETFGGNNADKRKRKVLIKWQMMPGLMSKELLVI